MARNSGASKELALQIPHEEFERLDDVSTKLSTKPTRLGRELVGWALGMLRDPSRRPIIPQGLIDARQKLHSFKGDSYVVEEMAAPRINESSDDDPRLLKALLEAETAKRQLAETQLEVERLKHGGYPKGEE